MGELAQIPQLVGDFFDGLTTSLSKGSFATTSMVVVGFFFALVSIFGMGKVFWDWIKNADRSQSVPVLVLDFASHGGRYFMIWLFVGITPILFQSISGATLSTLKGLNAQVAAPAAGLLDTVEKAFGLVWSSRSAIEQTMAANNPFLFESIPNVEDAKQTADRLDAMKSEAMASVATQTAEAKKLQASTDPAAQSRGAALLASAKKQKQLIDSATSTATIEHAKALGLEAYNGSTQGVAENAAIRVMSFGISDIASLIKRFWAGTGSILIIAIPLVLILMAGWKILQSVISLFSHLACYAAVVSLAAAFSSVLGPLMVVTLATKQWERYGHAFVAFWMQCLAGTIVLAMAVKLIAVGIGSLSAMCATAGFAIFSKVTSSTGVREMIIAGVTAGLGFMGAGFAFQIFSDFTIKSPYAGIGPLSGSFHP